MININQSNVPKTLGLLFLCVQSDVGAILRTDIIECLNYLPEDTSCIGTFSSQCCGLPDEQANFVLAVAAGETAAADLVGDP